MDFRDSLLVEEIFLAHLAKGDQVFVPARNDRGGRVALSEPFDRLRIPDRFNHLPNIELFGIKLSKRGGNFNPHSHGPE